jgi:hypothetical protein
VDPKTSHIDPATKNPVIGCGVYASRGDPVERKSLALQAARLEQRLQFVRA